MYGTTKGLCYYSVSTSLLICLQRIENILFLLLSSKDILSLHTQGRVIPINSAISVSVSPYLPNAHTRRHRASTQSSLCDLSNISSPTSVCLITMLLARLYSSCFIRLKAVSHHALRRHTSRYLQRSDAVFLRSD